MFQEKERMNFSEQLLIRVTVRPSAAKHPSAPFSLAKEHKLNFYPISVSSSKHRTSG